MPENTVYVGRPTKWGNPFVIDEKAAVTNRQLAVRMFHDFVKREGEWSATPLPWPAGKIPAQWVTIEDVKRELSGKNLACWCPLGQPCHADVLLEIANAMA